MGERLFSGGKILCMKKMGVLSVCCPTEQGDKVRTMTGSDEIS